MTLKKPKKATPKKTVIKKVLTKDERIQNEFKRLTDVFVEISEDKKKVVYGLIMRAAFMFVTLEDYEKDINENGSVEAFSQSENQMPYQRGRPVVGFYNTMNKNYQSIIKQLCDYLPAYTYPQFEEYENPFVKPK